MNRNSSATSDYYYNKIAYDEEQSGGAGGQFEKDDVKHVMQRFKIVDKKLKSLSVMGCILIFIACLNLICDFLSPTQTHIQSKMPKLKMTSEEDACQKGWYDGRSDELGCLKFELDMMSHEDARIFCEKENASLIEVSLPAQLQVLVNIMEVLEASLGRGLWWSGGSNLSEKWTWRKSGRPIEDWVWGKDQPESAEGHNYLCFHYQVSYLGDDCYNNATWGRALCQKK